MGLWLENFLNSEVSTAVFLLLSFLAGVFTILAAGCNYTVIGAMAGFSASRENAKGESIVAWLGYLIAIGGTLAAGGALLGAIGGFGMLGIFTAVTLQMKRIYSGNLEVHTQAQKNLAGMFDYFDTNLEKSNYIVGWIDAFAKARAANDMSCAVVGDGHRITRVLPGLR